MTKKLGLKSPICTSKEATDENFNAGVRFMMENLDVFTQNVLKLKVKAETLRAPVCFLSMRKNIFESWHLNSILFLAQ